MTLYEWCIQNNRQDILEQWDYEVNKNIKNNKGEDISSPSKISNGSSTKVNWKLKYIVPDDYELEELKGKTFVFKWEDCPFDRTKNNKPCPYLSKKPRVYVGFNDLETYCKYHKDTNGNLDFINLLNQWDYNANKDLKPTNFTKGSSQDINWKLEYIVPNDYELEELRGKTFIFKWKAQINDRFKYNRLSICPYILKSPRLLYPGFNDLETYCKYHKDTNGNLDKLFLLEQWDYEANKNLKNNKGKDISSPSKVFPSEREYINWKLEYIVPNDYELEELRGKTFTFKWKARLDSRIKENESISKNQKLLIGFNDLETWCKYHKNENGDLDLIHLLDEWDYEANKNLKNNKGEDISSPSKIHHCTNDMINWKCKYGHIWEARLDGRIAGNGCQECFRKKQVSSYEYILLYYAKKIDKNAIQTYKTSWLGKRSIDIYIPNLNLGIEYDGYPWHLDAKGDEEKNNLCWNNNINLINIREPNLPLLEDNYSNNIFNLNDLKFNNTKFIFNYIMPNNKYEDNLILFLKKLFLILGIKEEINIEVDNIEILNLRKTLEVENSLAHINPRLAEEWHPTKNGDITPNKITSHDKNNYWWKCPYCGEDFYQSVDSRNVGNKYHKHGNCKIDTLDITHPKIATTWHFTKNKNLKDGNNIDKSTPDRVTSGSKLKAWWKIEYIVPNDYELEELRDKTFTFEWEDYINVRVRENKPYPFLSLKPSVLIGFNDLETWCKYHKNENGDLDLIHLLDEWDYEKNSMDINAIVYTHTKNVHWKKEYYDKKLNKFFIFEWEDSPNNRVMKHQNCPFILNKKLYPGFNDLATRYSKILELWDYIRNKNYVPNNWNISKKGAFIPENIIGKGFHFKAYFIGYEEPQYINTMVNRLYPKS